MPKRKHHRLHRVDHKAEGIFARNRNQKAENCNCGMMITYIRFSFVCLVLLALSQGISVYVISEQQEGLSALGDMWKVRVSFNGHTHK